MGVAIALANSLAPPLLESYLHPCALGRLSLSRRLPTKPSPPTPTMGVWFTSNCTHAEIVDHVVEAAKRALVDKNLDKMALL